MTSSVAKVNKSSGAHFWALFLKFPNFLMFLNIQIDLLILKTDDGQFTLTTKKSLHIIFNGKYQQSKVYIQIPNLFKCCRVKTSHFKGNVQKLHCRGSAVSNEE